MRCTVEIGSHGGEEFGRWWLWSFWAAMVAADGSWVRVAASAETVACAKNMGEWHL